MSTNKKYFYMRLKEDFFRSPELIAVLSLRGNGRIMAGAIPYSPEMIARATGHDCETVNEAIALFSDVGLIEKLDSGAIYMLDIQNFIGESSTEADRQRDYQRRIKEEREHPLGI